MLSFLGKVLLFPFRNLYIHGPAALGFWQGASTEKICAQLSGTSEVFWSDSDNYFECEAMIDRRFEAYNSLLAATLYAAVVYRVVADAWTRYFVMRPFLRDLRVAVAVGEEDAMRLQKKNDAL